MTIHGPDNLNRPDRVEEMLTEHLTAVLEPQRGKALAAFRAQIVSGAAREEGPAAIPIARGKRGGGQVSRRELWLWTGVPSLVAACLAVAVTWQVVGPKNGGSGGATPIAGSKTLLIDSPRVDQYEVTQRAAGGVVVSNDTPMQVVHEQTIQKTQWLDPKDNSTYTLTQPVERVQYLQVKPF